MLNPFKKSRQEDTAKQQLFQGLLEPSHWHQSAELHPPEWLNPVLCRAGVGKSGDGDWGGWIRPWRG